MQRGADARRGNIPGCKDMAELVQTSFGICTCRRYKCRGFSLLFHVKQCKNYAKPVHSRDPGCPGKAARIEGTCRSQAIPHSGGNRALRRAPRAWAMLYRALRRGGIGLFCKKAWRKTRKSVRGCYRLCLYGFPPRFTRGKPNTFCFFCHLPPREEISARQVLGSLQNFPFLSSC